MQKRLDVGDLAPDVTVQTTSGASVNLSTLWQEGPVVLAFLRHFG